MSGFFKKFRRDVAGIAWLASSLFTGLALLSFKATDPSFNSTGTGLKVHNYCGYIGSFAADLMYQTLGLSAWIVVFAAARVAVGTFRDEKKTWNAARVIWAGLLLVTVSSLMALYMPNTRMFSNTVPMGGLIGTVVSKGLVSAFNFLGVSIILWSLALMMLVFYTERSLKDLFKAPLSFVVALKDGFVEKAAGFRGLFEFEPLGAGAGGGSTKPRVKRESKESSESANSEKAPKEKKAFKILMGGKDESDDDSKESRAENAAAKAPVRTIGKGGRDDDESEEMEEVEESQAKPGFLAALGNAALKQKPAEPDVPRRKVKLSTKVERRIENWKLPEIAMLEDPPLTRVKIDEREINKKADVLVDKLAQFSVRGVVENAKPGPLVTMYEFKPAADVKISKITDLADDLSLALSSESVRIIAPIPGRDVVGIETSNSKRETVYLKDIIAHDDFWAEGFKLPICLGRQADGEPKVVDLRKMPHLMVAGTTGSGKSVFVVSAILGLLFRHSPKTLRLILVDPKQVDLATFNNVPHLLMPPIREPKKAVVALKWAVREMEKRYRSMSKFGARGLESYNEIVGKFTKEEVEKHEALMTEWELDVRKLEQYYFTPQPYICIVIEEFADLMA
ncbi:MAG: DNA translocase FtsK, partial [Proteobacteria bacterium]